MVTRSIGTKAAMATRLKFWALLSSLAIAIGGCGGGGGGGGAEGGADAGPNGIWGVASKSSIGRNMLAVVEPSGQFWLAYTSFTDRSETEGVVSGKLTWTFSSLPDTPARHFKFDGSHPTSETVSVFGSYSPKSRLTLNVSPSPLLFDPELGYDAVNLQTASYGVIFGAYSGTHSSLAGRVRTDASIGQDGSIRGTIDDNCSYTGSMTPQTDGNYYRLSITYGEGCASPGLTSSGSAIYENGNKAVFGFASNADGSAGTLLFLQRS